METNLTLPSVVNRGTNTKLQYLFRYNKATDEKTLQKFTFSCCRFFNLTVTNLPKNAKALYGKKNKDEGLLTLEFDDTGKKGLHFQEATMFLSTNPTTPSGQYTITEQSCFKISDGDWIKCFYRFPTPEETKQPGTVPVGVGEVPKKSKESYEKQYSVGVI